MTLTCFDDSIQLYKETGATVVAKGRYKAPGDTSAEPALYLYITGNQQKNVDDATAKINQIMNGGQGVVSISSLALLFLIIINVQQNSPFNAKVFVGIDPLADPSFPLMGKVVGPKVSEHIYCTRIYGNDKGLFFEAYHN